MITRIRIEAGELDAAKGALIGLCTGLMFWAAAIVVAWFVH